MNCLWYQKEMTVAFEKSVIICSLFTRLFHSHFYSKTRTSVFINLHSEMLGPQDPSLNSWCHNIKQHDRHSISQSMFYSFNSTPFNLLHFPEIQHISEPFIICRWNLQLVTFVMLRTSHNSLHLDFNKEAEGNLTRAVLRVTEQKNVLKSKVSKASPAQPIKKQGWHSWILEPCVQRNFSSG